MSPRTGILIAIVGGVLVLVGLLAAAGALSWFGRLPGDLRIQREGFSMFIPITSMLLASVAISLLAILLRRVL